MQRLRVVCALHTSDTVFVAAPAPATPQSICISSPLGFTNVTQVHIHTVLAVVVQSGMKRLCANEEKLTVN